VILQSKVNTLFIAHHVYRIMHFIIRNTGNTAAGGFGLQTAFLYDKMMPNR